MALQAITSYRRYCLGKRLDAREKDTPGLELVWKGKQQAQPGTALPAGFPYAAKLEPYGYTTVEDLNGADDCELMDIVGLTLREAQAVLTELQPLLLA